MSDEKCDHESMSGGAGTGRWVCDSCGHVELDCPRCKGAAMVDEVFPGGAIRTVGCPACRGRGTVASLDGTEPKEEDPIIEIGGGHSYPLSVLASDVPIEELMEDLDGTEPKCKTCGGTGLVAGWPIFADQPVITRPMTATEQNPQPFHPCPDCTDATSRLRHRDGTKETTDG